MEQFHRKHRHEQELEQNKNGIPVMFRKANNLERIF